MYVRTFADGKEIALRFKSDALKSCNFGISRSWRCEENPISITEEEEEEEHEDEEEKKEEREEVSCKIWRR